MSRFYITTPIYYVSDVPHLGHAYTTVVADALARFHRLRGDETFFLTGTDEHGQKIARLAEQAGVSPRAYADKFADAYRATWTALEITHDDFIRTTDPDHEATVQELWRRMEKNGAIYLGDYEGWYCVACEQYYTEKELDPGNECPIHHRPVEKVKEQSYYFRLSQYQSRLLELYEKHPNFVLPETRRNEVRAFVQGELRDLSVSRSKFGWGVSAPDHPGYVIWVWLDALTNYYSATQRDERAKKFWAPDAQIVHLIGKEISRFHAVYWPAFLMAAELPLPTTVFCHGWWTVDGEKMSKTLGNVVDPLRLSEDVGVDAFRYFVLREVPLGADGDFSHEAFLTRYNAELANDLGNALNRTLGMVHKYFGGHILPVITEELRADCLGAASALAGAMEDFAPSTALGHLWTLVRRINAYIDQSAPWNADEPRKQEILWNTLETLRFIANLIEPFLPERAAEMRRQLGVPGDAAWPEWTIREWRVEVGTPLFPRLDDDRRAALLDKWKPKKKASADERPQVSLEDFQKLDLRVAKIVSAEPIPKAKKLYKLTVDLGGGHTRQVVAGIAESYTPDELPGKHVVFLANLKPATIRGVVSEGMILAAGDDNVLALSALDRAAPAGAKVK